MNVKILKKFHDKADYSKVYLVGETFTFEDARAAILIARGLVESEEEIEVNPMEEPEEPEIEPTDNNVAEEPEIESAVDVAEEPEREVGKVQPIVKQTRRKSLKAN